MAYQSLYRRYRSGTFGELVGQDHVVTALKNAIVEGRVGHAYLFSGPRGTGKTSTARILAKALNCTDLQPGGEPCTRCESCLAFATGSSYDLHELDAASNNGVDAIRDLIAKVALGSPGRTKVYILDEVHMLTSGAENALLKTLEEPPAHVVFVLATTEPHKVVPTIRSRTQHFEFELLAADKLEAHVRWVADDAGLTIDDAMVEYVLRVGGGSARDTLSALDQVVAAGGVPHDGDVVEAVLTGLAGRDSATVVAAVSDALRAGRDPRVIGEELLGRLRDAFLCSMGARLDHLSDAQAAAAAAQASAMGPAAITRALETIGTALVGMRQAPDPRVDLEVALLRLTRPDLDTDVAALLTRIERLEQGASAAPTPTAATTPSVSPPSGAAPAPAPVASPEVAPPTRAGSERSDAAPERAARPADLAREHLARSRGNAAASVGSRPDDPPPTLGAARGTARPSASAAGSERTAPAASADAPAAAGDPHDPAGADVAPVVDATAPGVAAASTAVPSVEALEAAWDEVRGHLSGRAKSRFSGGRFLSSGPDGVVFGLPNAIHRDRCAECVADVETQLTIHFERPIVLQLVVDGEAPPPVARSGQDRTAPVPTAPPEADDEIDLSELVDAAPDEAGGVELLTDAFPGAEIIDVPPS